MLKSLRRFSNSIKFKILLSTLLLFILFISITVYVWYSSLTEQAEKTATNNISAMMKVSNDNFETSLKDINNVVTLTLYNSGNYINNSIMNILTGKNIINDKDLIKYRRDAEDYIISLCNFKHYLNSLAVFDFNGNSLSYGPIMHFDELKNQPWYEKIINSKGNELFIPPHYYSPWLKEEKDKVFSIARLVYDGKNAIGFVIADIKCDMLKDMFNKNSINGNTLFVIDNQTGELIFVPDSGSFLESSHKNEFTSLISQFRSTDGSFFTQFNGKESLIIYHKSNFTRWTIVAMIPKDTIMKSFLNARKKVLIISAVFCFAAISILFIITSVLTRNILKLNRAVTDIDKNNLDINVEIKSTDEIGQLYRQFGFMVLRIKELISEIKSNESKKRKAEIRALQAQINPHFLYNTLNTIKFLSILQGADNIKVVSEALSTMLHINMDNRSFIRIDEEMEYIKSYLSIQEYRYSNKFTASFIVDDNLRGYMIPKLLIQPLVENALQHGIAPLKDHGVIQLRVYEEAGILKIRVKDNGVGMSDEEISTITKADLHSDHIGVPNIQSRIKMIFGSDYGISIYSEINLYTIVEISIPLVSEEEIDQYA